MKLRVLLTIENEEGYAQQKCLFFCMKSFKFPTPYTVLIFIIAMAAAATWLLPAGSFDQLTYDETSNQLIITGENPKSVPATQEALDELGLEMELDKFTEGKISRPVSVPNTYHREEAAPQGFKAILFAPIRGIYESIDIILFVLIIGGFIGVFQYSGAMDKGIASLSHQMEGREKWLIVITVFLIALGGTTFGLQEETLAFYPILLPIFLAAGYDRLVAVAAIYCGSCVGYMGATINPFSTIIASDAAGVNWTTGFYSRLVMLVVGAIVVCLYIVRYAESVKKDSTKSLVGFKESDKEHQVASTKTELSVMNQFVLILFGVTFLVMIYGVSKLGWWFEEMTALFLAAAIVLGLVQRIKEKAFVEAFVTGARDLLGVSLIIGIARGITIVMNDGNISGTLLNDAADLVGNTSGVVFLPILMLIFFVMTLFIASTSGLALVSMPIMGALGNIVGVPTEEIVNAFLFGSGLMMFVTPSGVILPSLTMVGVPYNVWLKFMGKLMLWLALVAFGILIVGYLV
jgi:uncharacterized ion transporter superfamily protein YfcC